MIQDGSLYVIMLYCLLGKIAFCQALQFGVLIMRSKANPWSLRDIHQSVQH